MVCPAGFVVDVLVNCVGTPAYAVGTLKLAVGLAYIMTWVSVLLVCPLSVIVHVYVPAIAMVQLGRVTSCPVAVQLPGPDQLYEAPLCAFPVKWMVSPTQYGPSFSTNGGMMEQSVVPVPDVLLKVMLHG